MKKEGEKKFWPPFGVFSPLLNGDVPKVLLGTPGEALSEPFRIRHFGEVTFCIPLQMWSHYRQCEFHPVRWDDKTFKGMHNW